MQLLLVASFVAHFTDNFTNCSQNTRCKEWYRTFCW